MQTPATTAPPQQGQLVELEITDLADSGDGVGRYDNIVVFVPDTVTGDRVLAKLTRVKPRYANAKLDRILEPSPQRTRPSCIVADKCGGCQWQHIKYESQLEAKRQQVEQALIRLGGFSQPTVDAVLPAAPFAYRNKATYPVDRSSDGKVRAGYYQKGSHKIVNLNQCPVQDDRLDPLLAQVKQDIEFHGWSIYNESEHRGKIRHLAVRIGRRTGEMLLTIVTTDDRLSNIKERSQVWMERYPGLVGVCVNINRDRTNVIFGPETRCVAGREELTEEFAGLRWQLRPDTFFQVNTEAAETLLDVVIEGLNLQGDEAIVDAYCGIGTFALPLAQRVQQVVGIEAQPEAVELARRNAIANNIDNTEFIIGKVEKQLGEWTMENSSVSKRVVLLDPPRSGCDRAVLNTLLDWQPQSIAYVSCKASTLARDLKILCDSGEYRLDRVTPVDFFPQTPHVECVAFLLRV